MRSHSTLQSAPDRRLTESYTDDATESSEAYDDTTSDSDKDTGSLTDSSGWKVSAVSSRSFPWRSQREGRLKCMSADDITSSDTDSSLSDYCCDLQQLIEKQRWNKYFQSYSPASAAFGDTELGRSYNETGGSQGVCKRVVRGCEDACVRECMHSVHVSVFILTQIFSLPPTLASWIL